MKKILVNFVIVILLFTSCNDRELGNEYYFLPKYEAIDVGYPNSEAIIYKSNQEYLYSDVKIRGDVLKVNSDSKFVIAKRDPLLSEDQNSGEIEYYIIDKKIDKTYGPLTKNDFEKRIEVLKVNLEFD